MAPGKAHTHTDRERAFLVSTVLSAIVHLLWLGIALPVFQSGMIRYVHNDNWKALFNAPANFVFFTKNIKSFIKFYIFWLLLTAAVFVVDLMLVLTVLGTALIPAISVTAYYVSSAHELGNLATTTRRKQDESLPAMAAG